MALLALGSPLGLANSSGTRVPNSALILTLRAWSAMVLGVLLPHQYH